MMITKPTKIISGGQTGVDQGALIGACAAGIETGGWMPRDFQTEDGPNPDFAAHFGLLAHRSLNYATRTWRNVADSDGTIWVRSNADPDSPGYRCTKSACVSMNRPFLEVQVGEFEKLRSWVAEHKIQVLNVAGSRESRWPGAQTATARFIELTFTGKK